MSCCVDDVLKGSTKTSGLRWFTDSLHQSANRYHGLNGATSAPHGRTFAGLEWDCK